MPDDWRTVPFQDVLIHITDHAVERFLERWLYAYPTKPEPRRPLVVLAGLLGRAEPFELPPAEKVRRIIAGKFKNDAQYWEHDGWCFVTKRAGANHVLVTVLHREMQGDEH